MTSETIETRETYKSRILLAAPPVNVQPQHARNDSKMSHSERKQAPPPNKHLQQPVPCHGPQQGKHFHPSEIRLEDTSPATVQRLFGPRASQIEWGGTIRSSRLQQADHQTREEPQSPNTSHKTHSIYTIHTKFRTQPEPEHWTDYFHPLLNCFHKPKTRHDDDGRDVPANKGEKEIAKSQTTPIILWTTIFQHRPFLFTMKHRTQHPKYRVITRGGGTRHRAPSQIRAGLTQRRAA